MMRRLLLGVTLLSVLASLPVQVGATVGDGDEREADDARDVYEGVLPVEERSIAGTHCETCFNLASNHVFDDDPCGPAQQDLQFAVLPLGPRSPAASVSAPSLGEPDGCYDCHSLNACHDNKQSGECGDWHNPCSEQEDFDRVAEAIESADVAAVGKILAAADAIVLNVNRGAIQVRDCQGATIGHLVVPGDWVTTLSGQ